MTALSSAKRSRLRHLVALPLVALGVSACGLQNRPVHQTTISATEIATGFEPYFFAGNLTYQIQVTRQLNPFDQEDAQYLAGVPGAQNIGSDQLWFGVFMWAKNQTGGSATTSDNFTIVDSAGTVYRPVVLPATNPYAWTAQQLGPDGIEPSPDSPAGTGATGGGLILFKLSNSIYANRPLTLDVYAPGQSKPSRVALDL